MRRVLALALWLALAPHARAGAEPEAAPRDALADALVERLLRNLGGADAPYRARSIAFTFEVEREGAIVASRRHVWHPASGRHELAFEDKDGARVAIDTSVLRREGSATRAGSPVASTELGELLERAYKAWVNDTYWLLMPYKLRDPGVKLAYAGEALADGRVFDRVQVTFGDVGLTPGDTYWAWIARDTGLMERWSFVLQGQQPPAAEFRWRGFQIAGPLVVATRKERPDGSQVILTHELRVE